MLLLLQLYASYTCCEVRPCVLDCCIERENGVVVHLLLSTNHTYIHRGSWLKRQELEAQLPLHRCCCAVAAAYVTDFVAARLSDRF